MKVKIIEREVLNPLADTSVEKIKLISMPKVIKEVSFLNNTKPNADIILDSICSELKNIDFINVKKPAGAPATPEQIKKAVKGDVSILAVGDCGSCTTWLILDAIRLEKEGIPTISICSHKFYEFAITLAKAQGADNLRIVKIEHPISGQREDEIKVKTQIIVPKIKNLLNMN